jgi:hypothetical protein
MEDYAARVVFFLDLAFLSTKMCCIIPFLYTVHWKYLLWTKNDAKHDNEPDQNMIYLSLLLT